MAKLSEKLIKQYRKKNLNKIIHLTDARAANELLDEIETKIWSISESNDYDPNHKVYLIVQNMLSYFAEDVSDLTDFREYYDKVVKVEEEFMPSGPPSSPLTGTYFTFWAFCDLRFGRNKETIASIFYDLGKEYDLDDLILKTTRYLSISYMSFFEHIGFDDNLILLKEILTGKISRCICPAGYRGRKNEIWFVRIVPNLDKVYEYHIVINTPYIIAAYSKDDWVAFFKRQGLNPNNGAGFVKIYNFLKHPKNYLYWHNYLMDAYVDYQTEAILLTGIPDIKGSKPHELG